MPHEQLDLQQVAAYLHLDARDVEKMASRQQIPARKVGGSFLFIKSDIDHWVETQMHTLGPDRMAKIGKGVSAHHGFEHEELILPLIPPSGIVVPLAAKTREAVLRGLVEVAENCGRVYSRDDLLNEIRKREELCSTSMIPNVAIPHPRHPVPYDISESFIIAGLTSSGVPFAAEDGSLTRLFFLICCKEDRTHLHVLARLACMLHDSRVVQELLHAETEEEMRNLLHHREQQVLGEE